MGLFDLFRKKDKDKTPVSKEQCSKNNTAIDSFEMIVEDVLVIKDRGIEVTGRVAKGRITVGDTILCNGKEYKALGIEMFGKLLDSASEGDNIGILIDTFDKYAIKRFDIVSKSRQLSEFGRIQRRCSEISQNDSNSEELIRLKEELWKQLLNQEAIWVAYDEDTAGDFPFIGLMGLMEVFTKEDYAVLARKHFSNNNEGHFSLRKIEKESIEDWFKYSLYIGATVFNLDNGIAPVQFKIEDYIPYDNNNNIDYKNRDIRSYLLRTLQIENRYHKMTGEKTEKTTQMYNQIISVLVSNGYTALVNGTVYALVCGPYIEKAEILSKAAFEKHKDCLREDSQTRQYLMELTDELKIPTVANETVLKEMISSGNVPILSIEKIMGLETVVIPNRGRFVPIFTDKAGAQNMRSHFMKYGEQYGYNIVAVTFAEIISILLTCDGAIVDSTTYSYMISKEILENIKKQIENSEQ